MTNQERNASTFQAAARRVVARLFAGHWVRLLGRSAAVVFPVAMLIAAWLWYCELPWANVLLAIALVPAWLVATCAWAWLRRPSAEAALAYWDQGTDRDEMFMSAYCFATQPSLEVGEQIHLSKATKHLHKDLADLPRDLPIPVAHRTWALPAAFVALVGLSFVMTAPAEEARISDPDQARAEEVAEMLASQAQLIDKDESLTPKEEEELKKLEQSVKETADKLRELDNETHRDVLAELEARAHSAEQLAESMEGAGEDTLSSKMLEELARHADTTDFASAMQAKDLQKGSDEAEKLAERLEHKDLSLEEQKRVERALDSSLEVATKQDKQGLVGKHLKEADEQLKKNKPKEAANKFKRLAKRLEQAKQRQLAKQRLEQLARELRNSGQQIFGRDPSQIRRLNMAANPQQGLQQLGAQQLQAGANMPLQQRMGNPQQGQLGRAMMAGQLPAGQLPNAIGQAPIPGSNAPLAPGNLPAPMPGSGQIPIPGTGQCPGGQCPGGQCPGGQCAGGGQIPGAGGAGSSPVPGTAGGMGAGDGGHFAGHGSAGYGNTPTNPLAATGTGVVNAAVSGDGPSQVRNVDQGSHREQTRRNAQDLAIDFIKIEEEALAEEPLPLSRRQQVLRYFTAIRRQLVEPESTE